MEEKQLDKNIASKLIANGETLRAFKDTIAYKLIYSWITDKVVDSRDAWLKATPEQAEAHRQRAGAYKELLDFIEHQIKVGDVYNDMLKKESKERDPYA